ncbi:hypothetical protein L210DRAFT_3609530 [Boletus edulis BED1]|uniref:Uncharacterized protein n=1 Tax=Boletus edulis BED1 TaxID=1328754 RepID=A0AAD4GKD7_BOLED|nr:hypothetical protein L210DRAFT_3609530 [Boletus edulis BED1]
MAAKLNVSLEPHLQDTLMALLRILPEETCQQLTPHLSPETNTTVVPLIPYELILQISRWCQTTDGKAALRACSPPLDPQSYTMVSLLAGTRTSPEKHFPPYTAKDPEEDQRLRTKDRKAIATLVNAVLSVVGTGVATWLASEHTAMRLEWRALMAVSTALVVALAEIVLYMIWDSRQASRPRRPARKYVVPRQKEVAESSSGPDMVPQASSTAVGETNLRHRTTTSTTD